MLSARLGEPSQAALLNRVLELLLPLDKSDNDSYNAVLVQGVPIPF